MSTTFRVLLSSAGRRVALLNSFRQTLGDLGLEGCLLAADCSTLAAACHVADVAIVVPSVSDPGFLPSVLAVCEREGVDLLVPTIDPELPVYANARGAFEAVGTRVAVSAPAVTEIGGDKVRTHEWLCANGFPTVRQASVETVLASPGDWPFPLIVKPRFGSASVGVEMVRDAEALRVAVSRGEYVVQTLASGAEYTIDVLADREGRAVCAVPRRRIEVRAGEVSKAVTERRSDLDELARGLCGALPGAYGALNFQVFADAEHGTLRVIELNARFGGGFPLTWEAGGRFPQWMVDDVLGRPTPAAALDWRDGLVMLRYDEAVFISDTGSCG